MKHIAGAAVLDDEIRTVDRLIAELARQIADVALEHQGLGHTIRSAETVAAVAPFRQHIADLEAEVSAWRHERMRHEYRLAAWSNGIELATEPELDIAVTDLADVNAKYEDAERDARSDTLANVLSRSADAVAEKRAKAANVRNAKRAKTRADRCIGPGCEQCAEHARPELPAPGTPEREALDALVAGKFDKKPPNIED